MLLPPSFLTATQEPRTKQNLGFTQNGVILSGFHLHAGRLTGVEIPGKKCNPFLATTTVYVPYVLICSRLMYVYVYC